MNNLALRWIVGLAAGSLLIAVSSPLFVRSYLPLKVDPIRRTWVLAPHSDYRWRSEGYATTDVGPHGMPGRTSLTSVSAESVRVGLWGDSQAEGVCLGDRVKLFAQIERAATATPGVAVYPFARSGEDAADWLTQMPLVEQGLSVDAHVILIVDLPDLLTAPSAPLPLLDRSRSRAAFANYLPAFVIQAGRRLLTEPDGSTRRELRFRPGPVASPDSPARLSSPPDFDWQAIMAAIDRATLKPVLLVYAPPVPNVIDGVVTTEPPYADEIPSMIAAARQAGLTVVDARPELFRAASEGLFPHGFHNGQIGVGHLNAIGYAAVANAISTELPQLINDERLGGDA